MKFWILYIMIIRGVFATPTDHHPELTIRLVWALLWYLPTLIDVTASWQNYPLEITYLPLILLVTLLFDRYSNLLFLCCLWPFSGYLSKPELKSQLYRNRFTFRDSNHLGFRISGFTFNTQIEPWIKKLWMSMFRFSSVNRKLVHKKITETVLMPTRQEG